MILNVDGTLYVFLEVFTLLKELPCVDFQSLTFNINRFSLAEDWQYLLCSEEELSYVSQRIRPSEALAMKLVFNIDNK